MVRWAERGKRVLSTRSRVWLRLMCLILFALEQHPQFPLVIAANRDERYARPTQPLAPWPEAPQLLAGRDLEAGGSWLGVTRSGRFAAVTPPADTSSGV